MTHAEHDEKSGRTNVGASPHSPRGRKVLGSNENAEGPDMAAKTRFALKGKTRDSYLELVRAFPLTSIKSDDHLAEAPHVMDRLLATGRLTKARKPTSTP